MRWQTVLTQAWLRRGALACAMWPLAQVYGVLQRRHARTARLAPPPPPACPVVVIGNVVAGGAGKTPLTIALAQTLIARGESPAVLSKGYGRQSQQAWIAVTPDAAPADVGDEPLVMSQALGCPVVVCAQRATGLERLLSEYPQTTVVLCDDGLQDPHLHRDIEVIAFDERGVGNGWLLPAGPLREAWPRASAAHVTSLLVQSAAWGQEPPALPGEHGPLWHVWRQLGDQAVRLDGHETRSLTDWNHTPVQALAGIAKPASFFNMLKAAGLNLAHTCRRPDHDDMLGIEQHLKPELPVFTTAKDAVKLRHQLQPAKQAQFWVVGLTLTLPDSLISALTHALVQRQSELSSRHG